MYRNQTHDHLVGNIREILKNFYSFSLCLRSLCTVKTYVTTFVEILKLVLQLVKEYFIPVVAEVIPNIQTYKQIFTFFISVKYKLC